MDTDTILIVLIVFLVVNAIILAILIFHPARLGKTVREEFGVNRQESAETASQLRQEIEKRLDQVQIKVGEMQSLAAGVNDLKRMLTNVRIRGGWGEMQLKALIDDYLTPEQYLENAATDKMGQERVEFAIVLPGKGAEEVLIPIDSKFPHEDYERLVVAIEAADTEGIKTATKALETRIKSFAKDISSKYINPPRTTDFAVMFLPTEGLFAEVLRLRGLQDHVQREYRVMIAGPTTFGALLTSLQMGFRTLAIEKRSSEVWKVLGAVKTEFGKFSQAIDKTKKHLDSAFKDIDGLDVRNRAMSRQLRTVEELPEAEAQKLLSVQPEGSTDDGPVEDRGED